MKKLEIVKNKNKIFWASTGMLCVLLVIFLGRDISRPFYGLHSWKEAAAAWRARAYLKYPLSYTKGLAVWAVGDPPPVNPNRSLDHPQLELLAPALDMAIFGVDERGLRIGGIIRAVISLLLLLKILRAFLDDKTTLLAGLMFVMLPITGYFGVRGWVMPAALLSMWFYLKTIGSIKDKPPKPGDKWILAVLLFVLVQLSWEGFFYALAIGVHYVSRCIYRKQFPAKALLGILVVAPLSGLAINFGVMAAAYGWDWNKIWALYQWRSAKGEMPEFLWGAWFARILEHAVTNFTVPVLVIVGLYLVFGQMIVFASTVPGKKQEQPLQRFPQFWLFLLPALFQLFILKGALWQHQYWESPFVPFIAIAVALAIMLLADLVAKADKRASYVVITAMVALVGYSCWSGLNYYYEIRWQAPEKIKMFKDLNARIPPDKALLSYEDFIVNQHPVKGPHYRPEIAWYLDRQIQSATSPGEIERFAQTGEYPYYLVPAVRQLAPLITQLERRYKSQYIPAVDGQTTKEGKFLKAGMMPYLIFDLKSRINGG